MAKAADEIERLRSSPVSADTIMTPEQRAEMMWRIHPKDLQARGITRVEFYAAQIREAIADNRDEDHECVFRDAYLEISAVVGRQGSEACSLADQVRALLRGKPMLCEDCGKNYADPPSRLCPGCAAYQEHQR